MYCSCKPQLDKLIAYIGFLKVELMFETIRENSRVLHIPMSLARVTSNMSFFLCTAIDSYSCHCDKRNVSSCWSDWHVLLGVGFNFQLAAIPRELAMNMGIPIPFPMTFYKDYLDQQAVDHIVSPEGTLGIVSWLNLNVLQIVIWSSL